MSTSFYRAFEDKYRGSRELIKQRVSIYMPFITQLKEIYPDGQSLDIGCGRGEWLEILRENNFKGIGIDLDEGMLSACKELGLDVINGDGIKYLTNMPNDSLIAISAFHVVEHINFETLQTFIEQSLRVLKPGGILIMETPNVENIVVGTSGFYLDPTHIKPIPPQLLSFLPEYYGYKRCKIVRVQESKEYPHSEAMSLKEVLYGVSPDYAVVAQKSADLSLLDLMTPVFNKDYGVSLEKLTSQYDQRVNVTIMQLESRIDELFGKYQTLVNSPVGKINSFFQYAYSFVKKINNLKC